MTAGKVITEIGTERMSCGNSIRSGTGGLLSAPTLTLGCRGISGRLSLLTSPVSTKGKTLSAASISTNIKQAVIDIITITKDG